MMKPLLSILAALYLSAASYGQSETAKSEISVGLGIHIEDDISPSDLEMRVNELLNKHYISISIDEIIPVLVDPNYNLFEVSLDAKNSFMKEGLQLYFIKLPEIKYEETYLYESDYKEKVTLLGAGEIDEIAKVMYYEIAFQLIQNDSDSYGNPTPALQQEVNKIFKRINTTGFDLDKSVAIPTNLTFIPQEYTLGIALHGIDEQVGLEAIKFINQYTNQYFNVTFSLEETIQLETNEKFISINSSNKIKKSFKDEHDLYIVLTNTPIIDSTDKHAIHNIAGASVISQGISLVTTYENLNNNISTDLPIITLHEILHQLLGNKYYGHNILPNNIMNPNDDGIDIDQRTIYEVHRNLEE